MLGKLDNAAGVCDWTRFLFLSTRQALLLALRKCKDKVYNNKSFATYIKDAHNNSDDEFGLLRKKFALSKIAKGIWNSKCKCFITTDLKQELMMLESIIKNPSIQWSTPVSHLVKRSPDFEVWGDSSLKHAGGYSHNMKFWWHIEWPTSIQSKTLDKFVVKAKIDEKIISINLLEYCVIIINYAIASHLLEKNLINTNQEYPLLLNWTDNMSAMAWTKKAAVSTPAGKALSKIFCYLCMNNDMACISDYINTTANECADLISRPLTHNNKLDFSILLQKYPQLKSYKRLQIGKEFLSCLIQALLQGHCPPLGQLPKPLQKTTGDNIL